MTIREMCRGNISPNEETIKNEPMVFSATPSFAYNNGGPLTKHAVDFISQFADTKEDNVIIDTRVHMLKPGWFPSIPGWHCDAVPRDNNGHVLLGSNRRKDIRHVLFVVDCGSGSLTEFPEGNSSLSYLNFPPVDQSKENLWGVRSQIIKGQIKAGNIVTRQVESGKFYLFDAYDYHNTTPATGHGFRFFFRASFNTLSTARNEKRNQVQTYLPYEDLGW